MDWGKTANEQYRRMRFDWTYLIVAFIYFLLIVNFMYHVDEKGAITVVAIGNFLMYLSIIGSRGFFKTGSPPRHKLHVAHKYGFFALAINIAAFFLFTIKPVYWFLIIVGSFFLAVSLQKSFAVVFRLLEHRMDQNFMVRTPDTLAKLRVFWQTAIVGILFVVVTILFFTFNVIDPDILFLFFTLVSFFISFVMFRFTQILQENQIIRRHLASTSNNAFTSVLLFLFGFVFSRLDIPWLPQIVLLSAVFFFSLSVQKIMFIGWFVR